MTRASRPCTWSSDGPSWPQRFIALSRRDAIAPAVSSSPLSASSQPASTHERHVMLRRPSPSTVTVPVGYDTSPHAVSSRPSDRRDVAWPTTCLLVVSVTLIAKAWPDGSDDEAVIESIVVTSLQMVSRQTDRVCPGWADDQAVTSTETLAVDCRAPLQPETLHPEMLPIRTTLIAIAAATPRAERMSRTLRQASCAA